MELVAFRLVEVTDEEVWDEGAFGSGLPLGEAVVVGEGRSFMLEDCRVTRPFGVSSKAYC